MIEEFGMTSHDFHSLNLHDSGLLNALFLENPPLPQGGKKTLPKSDQLWISQALFTTGTNGKAKLDWHRYVCLLLCNEDIFEKILLKRKKHFQVLGGGLPNLAPSISSELLRTGFSFP